MMSIRIGVLLLGLAVGAATHAQEAEPAPSAESKSSQPMPKEKPASDQADSSATSASSKAASAPRKPASDNSGSPQRFIPSEQVRADFDVSFPVDI